MNINYEDLKYDAFISYRHTTPDMEIAEKIHKLLETTKAPKGMTKIQRVFRDRDELPTSSNLADSILDALKNSRYLIVVCSPRTPLSQWVIKEIETFRSLHGNDRILALLIEGEPEESFPKELVFVNDTQIEPLAADIRGKDLKKMKKNLKYEILRILAPIYGCNFDDLKQRHRIRKLKKIAIFFTFITLFSLLFGSFSLRQAMLLQDKTIKLEKSESQLLMTNQTLESQMHEILIGQSKYIAKEALALTEAGDRRTAILIASKGLPTDFENLDRPYVPDAEYALFNAINPYKIGNDFYGDFYAHHSDGVESMSLSADGKYIVSQSTDAYIYVWDTDTQELVYKEKYMDYAYKRSAEFVPDTTELIYLTESGLQKVDFLTGEIIWNNGVEMNAFASNFEQGILIGSGYEVVYICDLETGKLLETKPLDLLLTDSSFDTSGNRFICKNNTNDVLVYNINKENGNILTEILKVKTKYDNFIYYTMSSDGKTVVVSSNDYSDAVSYIVGKGEMQIIDVDSDTKIKSMVSENESYMKPIFNSGNEKRIHWYSNSVIHTYDLDLDAELPSMAHGEVITDMKSSIDGSLIMASAYDGTIRYFNVETGAEYEFSRFTVPERVDQFEITNGILVTMSSFQEDLIVWKSMESPSLYRYDYETEIANGFFIGNDTCITISYNGEVSLWDTKNQMHMKVLSQYDTAVKGKYIANKNIFILVDQDGNASSYDATSYEKIKETKLENFSYYSSSISEKDGSITYMNSDFSSVIVYDSDLIQVQNKLINDYIGASIFSENEEYITYLNTITDGEEAINPPSNGFIAFSSVDDYYAISSAETLQLYYKNMPNEMVKEIHFNSVISALKFNPTKDEILVGLEDKTLYVYNCQTEESTLIDGNLPGVIGTIRFTNDDCITSLNYSGWVQFRECDTYIKTSEMSGFIDISPDGKQLLFADYNSLLQAPRLSAADLIELGKTIVGTRVLTDAELEKYSITNQ